MNIMEISAFENAMVWAVFGTAIIALLYALWLARQILAYDKGTEEMQKVWREIKKGANTYLSTQLRTVAIMIAVLTVLTFLSVFLVRPTPEARHMYGDNARMVIGLARAGAFFMGSTFSAIVEIGRAHV